MKLRILLNIDKLEKSYTDKQGNPQTSYSVNYEQKTENLLEMALA